MIKVTILMAIYKPNMKWLEEQLGSLNAQTYNNLELLVWNDAPDDITDYELILKNFIKNFHYRIYKGEKNLGSNGAFEELTKLATSEYVAYCDQDDIWLPEKISVLVSEAIKTKADLLCSDMFVIDGESKIVANKIIEVRPRQIFYEGKEQFKWLLEKNFCTGCTTLVRTEFAKSVLPFPKEFVHDWWLALCASSKNKLGIVRKSLIRYRIHGNNQTGVLSGVVDKETYYDKRIKTVKDRAVVVKNYFKDAHKDWIDEFNLFADCRVKYFENFSFKNAINLWRLRRCNKMTTYFELLLPLMPNFVFKFLINQIRKGNI